MIYEQSYESQTALAEWSPLLDGELPLYSVYRTAVAIELRRGCAKREAARLICTQSCYDDAEALCEILAEEFDLPVKRYQ